MSMPVLTYGCTRCDLKAWDAMTWGYRFYQVKKEQYRMAVSMGWCHVCSSLVPVERRPQAGMERSLQAEQASLQAHVRLLRQQQPGARWWLFRRPASRELLQAELKLESVSNDLLRLRRLLSLMKDRQSGDRLPGVRFRGVFPFARAEFSSLIRRDSRTPATTGLPASGLWWPADCEL